MIYCAPNCPHTLAIVLLVGDHCSWSLNKQAHYVDHEPECEEANWNPVVINVIRPFTPVLPYFDVLKCLVACPVSPEVRILIQFSVSFLKHLLEMFYFIGFVKIFFS